MHIFEIYTHPLSTTTIKIYLNGHNTISNVGAGFYSYPDGTPYVGEC